MILFIIAYPNHLCYMIKFSKSNTITGIVIIALNVVTTFMALAYCESLPYTWHICVTVDADGVITARKTISIIFGASAESFANRLPLIKISAISGTTSIRKKGTKYTLLFAKICFRFIPAAIDIILIFSTIFFQS